jgi:hypothetical protein
MAAENQFPFTGCHRQVSLYYNINYINVQIIVTNIAEDCDDVVGHGSTSSEVPIYLAYCATRDFAAALVHATDMIHLNKTNSADMPSINNDTLASNNVL